MAKCISIFDNIPWFTRLVLSFAGQICFRPSRVPTGWESRKEIQRNDSYEYQGLI